MCDYCIDDPSKRIDIYGDGRSCALLSRRRDEKWRLVVAAGDQILSPKVNYCPMCGRKLEAGG